MRIFWPLALVLTCRDDLAPTLTIVVPRFGVFELGLELGLELVVKRR